MGSNTTISNHDRVLPMGPNYFPSNVNQPPALLGRFQTPTRQQLSPHEDPASAATRFTPSHGPSSFGGLAPIDSPALDITNISGGADLISQDKISPI